LRKLALLLLVPLMLAATDGITLSVTETFKEKGYQHVRLAWSPYDVTQRADVYMDGQLGVSGSEGIVNGGEFFTRTGYRGSSDHTFKVCIRETGECSNEVTALF
jgi:hypothetical protein